MGDGNTTHKTRSATTVATPTQHPSTQAAAGVRGGTQARQPAERQLGGHRTVDELESRSGVSLEDVRAWIRDNQTVAVTAGFAIGLFMGLAMRR